MFDISWSELLILAVVTLIFVGPKDLPRFLAFVGKWAGVAKRHASEFRQVFDQAMREAELDQMRREVEEMQANIERTVREADKKTAEAAAAASSAGTAAKAEDVAAPHVGPDAGDSAQAVAGSDAPQPTPDGALQGPEVVPSHALEPAAPRPDADPVPVRQGGG